MRIVSLLPAATEMVAALGLGPRLVGRSHECDWPASVLALPALTRARVDSGLGSAALDAEVRRIVEQRLPIYMLDEARLAQLQPDVVVTQEACEVCAISYDQVVSSLRRTSPRARVVSLRPARLEGVLRDVETVAAACGVPEAGVRLADELRERLLALEARPLQPRPRVAVVEWLSPLMLAGHWVPDVIAAAGGVPVGPRPGVASPYVRFEELEALRPDAVIVAPCGFDLARTVAEAEPLRPALASLGARVLLMDGNAWLNRPGPRLLEAAEAVAAWLRGDDAPHPLALADPPPRGARVPLA